LTACAGGVTRSRPSAGDYNRQQLSIRGEDLRSLAVVMSCEQSELVEMLEEAGLLQSGT
jgi:hypothetical protein